MGGRVQNSKIALCLFGSVARGTTDAASDKDLLVVCDKLSTIPDDVREGWRKEGWTLAHYTWQGIRRRAARGDLLLQHLKQEGLILEDQSGALRQILNNFSPRADYFDEVKRASIILRPVDRRAGPPWQVQYLCGLTYEFARHAVLHLLASRQVYVFDYSDGVAALAETTGLLDSDDIDLLHSLRKLRSKYVAREFCDLGLDSTLDHARCIATRLFGFEFLDISADADVRILKGYSTIRDIEARILAHHNPLLLDEGEVLPDIWQLVQRPKAFNWARSGQVNPEVLNSINEAISSSIER